MGHEKCRNEIDQLRVGYPTSSNQSHELSAGHHRQNLKGLDLQLRHSDWYRKAVVIPPRYQRIGSKNVDVQIPDLENHRGNKNRSRTPIGETLNPDDVRKRDSWIHHLQGKYRGYDCTARPADAICKK